MARAISKARLRLVLLLTLLMGMVFAGVVPAHAAGTASISGTVTVPAGVDVTQTIVTLLVEVPDGYTMLDSEISPDPSGAYAFGGKSPGRYKIVFSNPATTQCGTAELRPRKQHRSSSWLTARPSPASTPRCWRLPQSPAR